MSDSVGFHVDVQYEAGIWPKHIYVQLSSIDTYINFQFNKLYGHWLDE